MSISILFIEIQIIISDECIEDFCIFKKHVHISKVLDQSYYYAKWLHLRKFITYNLVIKFHY